MELALENVVAKDRIAHKFVVLLKANAKPQTNTMSRPTVHKYRYSPVYTTDPDCNPD